MADAIAAATVTGEPPDGHRARTLSVDSLHAYYGDNHAVQRRHARRSRPTR